MSWIWWAVGFLGIGGTIAALVLFPALFPFLIGTKIGRIIMAVGAAVLVALGIYAKGKIAGRAAERARLAALTAKEVANAAAERKRITALTDEQVDSELSQWDRKP